MPVTDLRLPPGVHVCRSGRDYVFLDRRRDAYTGIAGPNASALDACLAGAAPAGLDALYAEGLLARPEEPGRAFELATIAMPAHDIDAPADARADPSAIAACLTAYRLLRRGPFERVCHAAECAATRGGPAEVPALGEAAARFARSRRWYPRSPGCLFDALALWLYLSRRGLTARWVFGVRLAPWAAHCWVQAGDHLVGTRLETVSGFSPIMQI